MLKTTEKNAKRYKKTVRKQFRNFQYEIASTLRKFKSNDPKSYWDYLKTKQQHKTKDKSPNCEDFADMFKNLGSYNNDDDANRENMTINFMNYLNIHMYMRDHSILDKRLTETEVKDIIRSLKTKKAHGLDLIINEFFKTAPDSLIRIITKLFNLILETGIIPSDWSLGVIKPIYKNKGNKEDPNNYRGITILSCFGKLFTCVLNKRLGSFIEQFHILGPEQTGFRKGYSTLDNVFTLYGIIDILLSKHKMLYCGFLDYEKAFDKIDRAFLWHKILEENINGKIINVIKNMYASAKSCVMVNNDISELFDVGVGVRQGENLSPLLFSLFLNDMNISLSNKMVGLTTISDELEFCNMKINIFHGNM